MTDNSLSLIAPALRNAQAKTLWVADENVTADVSAVAPHNQLLLVTNRFDLQQSANNRGLECSFSDFDFSNFADGTLDQVVYRVSKERPVVHHVINQAWRLLKHGGKLWLAGEKNEGIKGYVEKAGKLFGDRQAARKSGNCYSAELVKHSDWLPEQQLDDKDYRRLRAVLELDGATPVTVLSKPGVYGWNKEDQGSRLLMDTAETLYEKSGFPVSLVDLGCGYGYLTLRTRHWPITSRAATDNNAAAIQCAEANFRNAGLEVALSADDCGQQISSRFEVVLCNPPFHQGFDTSSELTRTFLRQTACLLDRTQQSAHALLVVNQFIALETLALDYFRKAEILANDRQFKVVRLSQPL
ncbi:methyltransferase [Pseudomaricurvus sp. HS19]|uniref:methyltransferase n=1 Tax=Pseudomaricurvus sp. HS19 TaxID=2692626 RepID=UPI00136CDB63|nr:methyltransferase [Pseudomaricurvus sp. HS19]MYM62305.1 methyltransferase [Pseudomaricurvus sp. HS19]